jgi:hypothetical protein
MRGYRPLDDSLELSFAIKGTMRVKYSDFICASRASPSSQVSIKVTSSGNAYRVHDIINGERRAAPWRRIYGGGIFVMPAPVVRLRIMDRKEGKHGKEIFHI